jgi:hypothetical protein
MSTSPSIVPDHATYLVLDELGRYGRVWRETSEPGSDRRTLIRDLFAGAYNAPVRIVAFNTTEGWARDVTLDIVDEMRRRATDLDELPEAVLAFLDTDTGH